MYLYTPYNDYIIQTDVKIIKQRLKRPDNYIDVLLINIFEELLEYLKSESFGVTYLLDEFLDLEKEEPDTVTDLLHNKAYRSMHFTPFIYIENLYVFKS